MSSRDIPIVWIQKYVDQVLESARKLDTGTFRDALLNRANVVMDLIQAWRESDKREK